MKGECPNCGFERKPEDTECFKCGIIYEKYEAYLIKKQIAQKEAAIKEAEERDQETRKLETRKTLFQKYMAEVNSDHIKAFTERHRDCILHPEIVKLVKIVETNPEIRNIDKAALEDRLDIIAKMPEEYFHDIGNLHAGRLWSLAGLQMMRKSGITTYMVTAQWDHETCPPCQILDGKIFEVKQAYNKIMKCIKKSRGAVTEMADIFASAFPLVRFEDVDNKSPEAVRKMGLLPPLCDSCRCNIISLGRFT